MKYTTTSPTPIRSEEPKRQTAKEVITANIKSLIEQLDAGHSEAPTAYLTAMSRFHNYSFGNILEIARQKPDATRVAGLYAWNQLGRKVKKGERGIRILAPIVGVRQKPQEEAEQDLAIQSRRVLVGFRNAYVFDVSQTEGTELPEMRQITGDVGENRDRLLAFIERQRIKLYFTEKIAPALGMSYGGRIAILSGQSRAEEFSTLVLANLARRRKLRTAFDEEAKWHEDSRKSHFGPATSAHGSSGHTDSSQPVSIPWFQFAGPTSSAQCVRCKLDVEFVGAAGTFAFLFGEPDSFFGDIGELGEEGGKCVVRGLGGKHSGGRTIVGRLRHCAPLMFQEGRIIAMRPASRPAAVLTGRACHSSGSGVAIKTLTGLPACSVCAIRSLMRALVFWPSCP